MAAISINGIEVPAKAEDTALAPEEIGSRSVAHDTSLLLARRGERRTLNFRTSWLRREEAAALAGLLSARGDVWRFDSTAYSGRGRAATSSTVNYRTSEIIAHAVGTTFSHPKFGSGCVAIEDASTNLFTSNVATGTDTGSATTGFTAVAGGTLSSVNTQAWQGSRSLQCVAASASDGWYAAFTATSGVQHAASVYMKVAAGTLNVTVKLRNETTTTDGTSKTVQLNTSWQRVEVLSPASVTIGDDLRLTVTTAAAGTFFSDGLKLEARAWSTTWADGALSAGALAYSLGFLRDTDDVTVMFWTRGPHASSNGGGTPYMFALGDASNRIDLYYDQGSGGFTLEQTLSGVSSGNIGDGGGFAAYPCDWTHVVLVMRRNPQSGSHKVEVYTNGAITGATADPSSLPSFGGSPTLRVGADYSGANRWNGLIDDLVVVPFGLTAGQIAEVYARGARFSTLPALDVYGDLPNVPSATPIRMVAEPAQMAVDHGRASGATGFEPLIQVSGKLLELQPNASS